MYNQPHPLDRVRRAYQAAADRVEGDCAGIVGIGVAGQVWDMALNVHRTSSGSYLFQIDYSSRTDRFTVTSDRWERAVQQYPGCLELIAAWNEVSRGQLFRDLTNHELIRTTIAQLGLY